MPGGSVDRAERRGCCSAQRRRRGCAEAELVDDGDFLEVHEQWATNIVCVFVRLDGNVVGVVANQTASSAGTVDIDATRERLVRVYREELMSPCCAAERGLVDDVVDAAEARGGEFVAAVRIQRVGAAQKAPCGSANIVWRETFRALRSIQLPTPSTSRGSDGA
ncbi:carboxyl transferase domain-containing protein [Umezawaea sp. Da 62-37]|uniref:carboxyl transferase domain-containing protein n=1 Tax=Umezawaea sp. Da 62-37 TaxID=3075927 RepID=UPI0028F6E289|nr:carboxyl transferase domain-containing protein [Umezawaea sp. Da 62-37]WNV91814.1 carboxyl transferase domain-containing protein [Umezawaea sp. Da 62-37]